MIGAYSFFFFSFVASLLSPFWGLIGIIVATLIRFQDRFPELVQIKPFMLLSAGLLLGCIIHRSKLVSTQLIQDKFLLGMVGFSALCLVLLAPWALISETQSFIAVALFYYFATRILRYNWHFIVLILTMAACIVYLGVEAIIDVRLQGESGKSLFVDPVTGRWQGIGYYANSNEFGQLMITTIPFLVSILLRRINIFISLLCAGFMCVMIYVLGKSLSRTCMVTLALMIMIVFMVYGRGRVLKQVLIAGCVGITIVGVLYVIPGPIQDRLSSILNYENDASFQGRITAWTNGFEMVTWYPFTGVGKSAWLNYHNLAPHNSFVQILAELGPVGFVLFLLMVFHSFKCLMRAIWLPPIKVESKSVSSSLRREFGGSLNKGSKAAVTNQRSTFGAQAFVSPDSLLPMPSEATVQGNPVESDKDEAGLPGFVYPEVDPLSRSIAIGLMGVFSGYLLYIFFGNHAYSAWTYFYLGLCGAVCNLFPHSKMAAQDKRLLNSQSNDNVDTTGANSSLETSFRKGGYFGQLVTSSEDAHLLGVSKSRCPSSGTANAPHKRGRFFGD